MSKIKQSGAVSLIVSVLTLILASGVVVYVNRSTIGEIISRQNQYNTKISKDAAEAGLAYVIAKINASGATYIDSTTGLIKGGVSPITGQLPDITIDGNTVNLKQYFEVTLSRASNTSPIEITSTGGYNCSASTDLANKCKATSTVKLKVNITNTTGTGPTDAMITVGSAVFDGSTCIEGGANGNAVHAGGTIQRNKTFSGENCTDQNGKGIYGDSFQTDGNLASLAGANSLAAEYIWGKSPKDLCANNQASGSKDSNNMVSASGKLDPANFTGGVYCFKGNVTFGGSGNDTFGSATSPVIIYVDGTVTFNGNAEINGVVHSTGSAEQAGGNVTINGSYISNGSMHQGSGNMKIRYVDYNSILNPGGDGKYRALSGSWKDWN